MMKAEAHDLIKLNSINENNFHSALPEWVVESLKDTPYVVVRRGSSKQIKEKYNIPIGIRGRSREKRFGCYMLKENCEKIITPEQIVKEKMWLNFSNPRWSIIFEQLEEIFEKWNYKLQWGPTGSVGFELATKHKVTSKESDIDLIIKPKLPLSVEEARGLLSELRKNTEIIDISMKTNKGWIALMEYANGLGTYLIKTEKGEELAQDIW